MLLADVFRFKALCHSKSTYITDLNLKNHKSLNELYFGGATEIFLQNENIAIEDLNKFKSNILNFYIHFCENLRTRINFQENIFKYVEYFEPENVMSGNILTLVQVLQYFPTSERDNIDKINFEYQSLADKYFTKSYK